MCLLFVGLRFEGMGEAPRRNLCTGFCGLTEDQPGGSSQAEKGRFRRMRKWHVSHRGIASASYVTELVL